MEKCSDCVFCRIVAGELPAYKIYEDEHFLAFLDIAPFCGGHTQVIPKKHYRWVWQVPNIGEYFQVVQKIACHYQRVFDDEWVTGLVWGLQVVHAHIQLLPAPKKLALDWPRDKLAEVPAKQLVELLAFKA